MGELVVTENMAVDGVIEQIDDWFSPAGASGTDTSDIEATLREHMHGQGALLLGRKTFEAFRGYWPAQTDDRTGIRDHLNRVPKYVVSTTLHDPEWQNTEVLRGDVGAQVEKLKERIAGEIGVTGSIMLVHSLIANGLIDEYRLFVHPVVVGRGRTLFEEATELRELELTDVKPFRSGVILVTYRPSKR
jgi:dihydrofolate reductase